MNILYINHYAGSPTYGMAFRPYYLAKEWIHLGHQVIILGADHSHLRSKQPNPDKDLCKENIDGISYWWIKTPPYQSSGFKRILNILTFVGKLFVYSRKISEIIKPDVVIASSTYPLDIYPAYIIAKKSNAKLIFELHDMWPLSPMLIGGYSKYHPFIWLMQRAENFSCTHSNGYVSMLSNAENYLIRHGLKPGKFVHITNGFHEDDWRNSSRKIPESHLSLFNKLKEENKLIIGYAGGHAPSNALEAFIEVASEFDNTNLEFVLVGNGPLKKRLVELSHSCNNKNIHFLPPVNKKEIPELLSHFDILYAGGISSKLHYYGTAYNKLTDYMLAQKPIIYAVDEPNSLVEKIKCGIQIPAEDKDKLIETINYLTSLSDDKRLEMGKRGHKYAIEELNYSTLAEKFIKAIEDF